MTVTSLALAALGPAHRAETLERMRRERYDLVVVGGDEFDPREELATAYAERFEAFTELRRTVAPGWARMARIG
jgi:hypothetical protein